MSNFSQGFVIRKVTIHKFNMYNGVSPTSVNFNGHLIQLFGKNGAGKSSVIDAITFALYKQTSRTDKSGINIADVCHPKGFTEVMFEKNGGCYSVRRARDGDSNSFSVEVYQYDTPEDLKRRKRINGSNTDLTNLIKKIIGIDYKGFINTIAIRQNEVKMLAEDDASKRGAILEHIFQLNLFEKAKNIASDKKKFYQNEVNLLQTKIREIELVSGDADEMQKQVDEKETEKAKIASEITELRKDIISKQKEKAALEVDESGYKKSLSEYEVFSNAIVKLESRLSSLAKVDKSGIPILKEKAKSLKELKQKKEAKQRASTIEMEIRIHASVIEDEEKKYKEKMEKYKFDVKKSENPIKVIEKFKQGKATIDDLRNAFRYEFVKEIQDQFKKDYESVKSEKENEIKALQKHISEINNTFDLASVGDIDSEIESAEDSREKLLEIKHQIEIYNTNKSQIESDLKENKEKVKSAEQKRMELESSHIKYSGIDDEISDLNAKKEPKIQTLASIETEIQNLADRIDKSKKGSLEINEIKKLEEESVKLMNVYTFLQEKVFHSRGVPSYALTSLFKELQYKASEIIYELTKHRTPEFDANGNSRRYQSITFKVKPAEKTSYGVDIEIDDKPIHYFSGGEKTVIAMAIRIAIAQQLAEMTESGTTIRMLFIDEGDIGSLDAETRDAYMELVENCGSFFDKIVMVTHLAGLTEDFDQIINITLDADGNSSIF